jgi:hypothetical protein
MTPEDTTENTFSVTVEGKQYRYSIQSKHDWFVCIAPEGTLCHGCGQKSDTYIKRPDGLIVCKDCAARCGWKENDT